MRDISMERVNETRKNILEIIESATLTHEQKLTCLANQADSLMEVLDLPEGLDELLNVPIDRKCICDLSEGHAPMRPRYIIPDYAKFLKEGSKFLQLDPPTDLYEALNSLMIFYKHVPSVTNYPVYVGQLDELLEPYIDTVDEAQAKKNLMREIASSDLDAVAEKGRQVWNEALGKIEVQGSSEEDKTIFYTSFYRFYERMICMSEDGRYYSGFDGKVHNDEGIPFYTDDWLWDTYRAAHPLRTIIEPEKESHMVNSYIRMSEQMEDYWMPTFPEVVGDVRGMNSNHGVAVVADCYAKGVPGLDLEKAYRACKGAITE